MSIIQGIPDEQVQSAIRHIIYNSADNEEREFQLTQMLRDIDVNNGFNKTSSWQTIEEFKANPVEGPCWLSKYDDTVEMIWYFNETFYDAYEYGASGINIDLIKRIMPIKTPEAPK